MKPGKETGPRRHKRLNEMRVRLFGPSVQPSLLASGRCSFSSLNQNDRAFVRKFRPCTLPTPPRRSLFPSRSLEVDSTPFDRMEEWCN